MTTMAIGNFKIWGPEAIRLVAVGVVGVTLFSLIIYLAPTPVYQGEAEFGPVSDFMKNPNTPLFLAGVGGASLFNGMFVVPLQAMAQRRAHPDGGHRECLRRGLCDIPLFSLGGAQTPYRG
jgi:hypothetical protein